ncbi:hypothetical protein [Kitasatospora sp. NPDC006786]|uniref:hypothetical protein n=1 Tax=unclassified Kitasatospora TaxID=2633591 RepID=UPI0033C33C1D
MSAEFGELVVLAGSYLTDADYLPIERSSELYRRTVGHQVADLLDLLLAVETRYAWEPVDTLPDRASTGPGPATAPDSARRARLHVALAEAARQLRAAYGKPPALTALQAFQAPRYVLHAIQALRTGLDLLATHTDPDGRPLTRHGLALESTQLRTAVLVRVLALAGTVADLVGRLGSATSSTSFTERIRALDRVVDQLGVVQQEVRTLAADPDVRLGAAALDTVRPRALLQPDPPRTAETPAQLGTGAAASADRLADISWRAVQAGDDSHAHTASAMGTAASNAVAVYQLTRLLFTHAATHAPATVSAHLASVHAADTAWEAAELAWRRVRACWFPLRSAPDSTLSAVTAESHALVDRVGRLLYADPAWRLSHGHGGPTRQASDIAAALPVWCDALRQISARLQHLAEDHAVLAERLADTRRLMMRASGPGHNRLPARPLPADRRAELAEEYRSAGRASAAAETALATVVSALGTDLAAQHLHHRLASTPDAQAADRITLRRSAARLAATGQNPQPTRRPRRSGLGL